MRAVICSACGEHVYDVRDGVGPGDPIRASDFSSARPDVAAPQEGAAIWCPLCGFKDFYRALQSAGLPFGRAWWFGCPGRPLRGSALFAPLGLDNDAPGC